MNSISGSVYIWYPKDENVGHCSLQIGDRNYPEHYVSWWPDGTAKFLGRNNVLNSYFIHNNELKQAPYILIPKEYDLQLENGQPHVTYHLHSDCFELVKMQEAWTQIKTKSSPHYRMVGKNCADIVGRVLTEGASDTCRRYVAKNARPGLFTTPRDIAVMLNQLARKGDVEKVVSPSCPKRTRSFMYVCLKMR
ncbi:hypothetical protein [Escherichia albertii]|uniref:Uncharacterized protein n=1 Tax=Escherichia albertii TaxID=208962 RepID=A0AAX3MVB5_ESCAL|nr:hypothetical protein [Escherichia albertii]MCZ8653741.1 hypothetical protein [Escherichia albertii]WDB31991.1 hypothetical protein PS049_25700 [Escherichia albertii]